MILWPDCVLLLPVILKVTSWQGVKKYKTPFIFQGGVAANAGMVRAFKEVFELNDDELLIPEYMLPWVPSGLYNNLADSKRADKHCQGLKELDELEIN